MKYKCTICKDEYDPAQAAPRRGSLPERRLRHCRSTGNVRSTTNKICHVILEIATT